MRLAPPYLRFNFAVLRSSVLCVSIKKKERKKEREREKKLSRPFRYSESAPDLHLRKRRVEGDFVFDLKDGMEKIFSRIKFIYGL